MNRKSSGEKKAADPKADKTSQKKRLCAEDISDPCNFQHNLEVRMRMEVVQCSDTMDPKWKDLPEFYKTEMTPQLRIEDPKAARAVERFSYFYHKKKEEESDKYMQRGPVIPSNPASTSSSSNGSIGRPQHDSPVAWVTESLEESEGEAPAIPPRPERTKSCYTAPRDSAVFPALADLGDALPAYSGSSANNSEVRPLTGAEALAKLQSLVSIGDPRHKFERINRIGEGGSGIVYTAREVATGTFVALKTINLAKQPKLELVLSEINIMRKHKHPNIVNYLDSYLLHNELHVVMEYLDGGNLADLVTVCQLDISTMAAVSREVLQAIYFLHTHGKGWGR